MLFGMNNNNPQLDKVEVPSLDTIQDLPNVDLPKLDEAQQPPAIPQVPTVPQTQTYNYAPTQTASYAAAGQPIITTKRSGGQIVALVFGIILTIIFGMLCLLLFIGDAVSGFVDFSSTIFGYGFTQAVINNILNERKSYAPITINAIFASILLIAGSVFGVEALKQSVNDSYSGSTNPYSIYVGAGCIVITLFVIIAVVGFVISGKVGKKKQEPQIQQ